MRGSRVRVPSAPPERFYWLTVCPTESPSSTVSKRIALSGLAGDPGVVLDAGDALVAELAAVIAIELGDQHTVGVGEVEQSGWCWSMASRSDCGVELLGRPWRVSFGRPIDRLHRVR